MRHEMTLRSLVFTLKTVASTKTHTLADEEKREKSFSSQASSCGCFLRTSL